MASAGVEGFCCTWSLSDTPHSVGLLWTSDQPDIDTLPDSTQPTPDADIHAPAVFEPAVPPTEWPQTCALDGAATDIGDINTFCLEKNI
jgi:hypothetical protein